MDVLLVRDVLLVHHVSVDPPLVVLPLEDVVKSLLEVLAVLLQVRAGVLAEQQQLPLVGLGARQRLGLANYNETR